MMGNKNLNSEYKNIVSTWKKRKINSVENLERALSNFSILFAFHSGVIENPEITYHNTREIFENGKIVNFTGDIRTIFEIENQKKCYEWMKDKIIQKEKITPLFIRKVHEKLMAGTYDERRYGRGERPGEYKKHDYIVGDNQGALPEEVAAEIEELCDELRAVSDKENNIVKAAAYLHCKFENIHPFADGNGRVGRTIMNYFLLIHDYPPLVVDNHTKDAYYCALGVYDRTGDLEDFVTYIQKATVTTWQPAQTVKKRLDAYLQKDAALGKEPKKEKGMKIDL